MKQQARSCPMCGEGLDTPMQIELCGPCYQDLSSSSGVNLHSTAEFAPIRPTGSPAQRSGPGRTRSRGVEAEGEVACTWCGKTRKEVKKLLASGEARICNECVALCADVLEAELGADWR